MRECGVEENFGDFDDCHGLIRLVEFWLGCVWVVFGFGSIEGHFFDGFVSFFSFSCAILSVSVFLSFSCFVIRPVVTEMFECFVAVVVMVMVVVVVVVIVVSCCTCTHSRAMSNPTWRYLLVLRERKREDAREVVFFDTCLNLLAWESVEGGGGGEARCQSCDSGGYDSMFPSVFLKESTRPIYVCLVVELSNDG